jgi:hypothetical protein
MAPELCAQEFTQIAIPACANPEQTRLAARGVLVWPEAQQRISLMSAVRAFTSRSRTRWRAWQACCVSSLIGTKGIVGWVTASPIASASAMSCWFDLTVVS